MNRRRFLGNLSGAVAGILTPAGSVVSGFARWSAPQTSRRSDITRRKVIVIVFGGGTRYSESMGDPGHRYVPRLWNELVPRGTLFTNVRVEGRVVHPNCTASIVTGHREYDEDNDWSGAVKHPTIFEILRKSRAAPDTTAWAFVYASILSKIGHSRATGFGPGFGANVVEPPTIPRETAERVGALLQKVSVAGSTTAELDAAREAAQWVRAESHINRGGLRSDIASRFLDEKFAAWKSVSGTTSHDAFLTETAIACMKRFEPQAIVLAFGEIDCAHYGSWSRYVEAIRRTDELVWRVWGTAQDLKGYRGQTLMLILPDHGRELERTGGLGYVHHSNFYTREGEDEGCRRIWMLMLGPRIEPGRTVLREVPQTAAAANALRFLGLEPSPRAAESVL